MLSQVALEASRSRVLRRPKIDEDDEDEEDYDDDKDGKDLLATILASKTFDEIDLFHPSMTKTERGTRVEATGQLYAT
ncbi:hypothetical protein F4776DRAFT_668229 [Hypoxylon sp. NC0597]|nr:hypothetical protein F4776DRAFT_668229 [Hypoxylon sp. NC0597]